MSLSSRPDGRPYTADLAAESAGHERVELVVLARRDVDLRRGVGHGEVGRVGARRARVDDPDDTEARHGEQCRTLYGDFHWLLTVVERQVGRWIHVGTKFGTSCTAVESGLFPGLARHFAEERRGFAEPALSACDARLQPICAAIRIGFAGRAVPRPEGLPCPRARCAHS